MKKILLTSFFIAASLISVVRADEVATVASEVSEQVAQETEAPAKLKEVLLINRSPFPIVFVVYDMIGGKALRRLEHIENGQGSMLSRDFFANQMQQLISLEGEVLAVGSAYGVEKIGPNSSAFMPEWKGLVLDTNDLMFLSLLFDSANVVEASMMFIGQLPILCINAPEAKMSFSIPCGEVKQAFGQNYPLFQAVLGTKEFTQALWNTSSENNPELDKMILFLQQVIVENFKAQQEVAEQAAQPAQEEQAIAQA